MLKITVNGTIYDIEKNENGWLVNGKNCQPEIIKISETRYNLLFDDHSVSLTLHQDEGKKNRVFTVNGSKYNTSIRDQYDLLLENLGMDQLLASKVEDIKAPMPGLVIDVKVSPGDLVKKGDTLLVLEAMKMENVLKSPHDGTIAEVMVKPRQTVEKSAVLISFV